MIVAPNHTRGGKLNTALRILVIAIVGLVITILTLPRSGEAGGGGTFLAIGVEFGQPWALPVREDTAYLSKVTGMASPSMLVGINRRHQDGVSNFTLKAEQDFPTTIWQPVFGMDDTHRFEVHPQGGIIFAEWHGKTACAPGPVFNLLRTDDSNIEVRVLLSGSARPDQALYVKSNGTWKKSIFPDDAAYAETGTSGSIEVHSDSKGTRCASFQWVFPGTAPATSTPTASASSPTTPVPAYWTPTTTVVPTSTAFPYRPYQLYEYRTGSGEFRAGAGSTIAIVGHTKKTVFDRSNHGVDSNVPAIFVYRGGADLLTLVIEDGAWAILPDRYAVAEFCTQLQELVFQGYRPKVITNTDLGRNPCASATPYPIPTQGGFLQPTPYPVPVTPYPVPSVAGQNLTSTKRSFLPLART